MKVKDRKIKLREMNKLARELDWIVAWEEGYFLLNTALDCQGILIMFSKKFNEIEKKIKNTLWMLHKAQSEVKL